MQLLPVLKEEKKRLKERKKEAVYATATSRFVEYVSRPKMSSKASAFS
jgi:hypothetical protein